MSSISDLVDSVLEQKNQEIVRKTLNRDPYQLDEKVDIHDNLRNGQEICEDIIAFLARQYTTEYTFTSVFPPRETENFSFLFSTLIAIESIKSKYSKMPVSGNGSFKINGNYQEIKFNDSFHDKSSQLRNNLVYHIANSDPSVPADIVLHEYLVALENQVISEIKKPEYTESRKVAESYGLRIKVDDQEISPIEEEIPKREFQPVKKYETKIKLRSPEEISQTAFKKLRGRKDEKLFCTQYLIRLEYMHYTFAMCGMDPNNPNDVREHMWDMFPNVMFEGEPGNGKTFTMEELAKATQRIYVEQLNAAHFVTKWQNETGKNFAKIIQNGASKVDFQKFIFYLLMLNDTASAFRTRGDNDNGDHGVSMDIMLNYVGESEQPPESAIFMSVNDATIIDDAWLSRMPVVLTFGPPTFEEHADYMKYRSNKKFGTNYKLENNILYKPMGEPILDPKIPLLDSNSVNWDQLTQMFQYKKKGKPSIFAYRDDRNFEGMITRYCVDEKLRGNPNPLKMDKAVDLLETFIKQREALSYGHLN